MLVLAREQYSADDLANIVRTQVTRSAREVIYRLPSLVEATTKWLDQYEKGQFTVHLDTSDLGKQVEKLNNGVSNAVNQLVMGLVLAGWIVGSAIATNTDSQLAGYKLGDFAFYMFVFRCRGRWFCALARLLDAYRSKEKKYY